MNERVTGLRTFWGFTDIAKKKAAHGILRRAVIPLAIMLGGTDYAVGFFLGGSMNKNTKSFFPLTIFGVHIVYVQFSY